MEGVIIKELNQMYDDRGWLVEIFREDEIDFTPVMSYISMSKPGVSRGPHEHLYQSDYFCFFGDFRLYLWDNRKDSPTYKEQVTFDTMGKPHIAVVPPNVVHAYKNVGNTEGLVLNLPDRLYRGKGKMQPVDEIRYEGDPNAPFRVE
ncbi:MAG: dTDP-4-dehydrorhamnose 3,5-epimerase family protein [Nitrospirae bacterium]|nr:dTDP-4-dehydrorhamnose 3,5-epimerase family protein [Nitrospirota bacterium]